MSEAIRAVIVLWGCFVFCSIIWAGAWLMIWLDERRYRQLKEAEKLKELEIWRDKR